MDEVEGLGPANDETWTIVFNGANQLEYEVTSGLTAVKLYRFKVRAVATKY